MDISAQAVKALRDKTGAGVMDCRKALTDAEGDMGKAEAILREKSLTKRRDPSRETKQGLVESYKHPNGQLGALVELNCETDFVSRTEDFRELTYEIALHVAATNPQYLDRGAISESALAEQRAQLLEQVRLSEEGTGDLEQKAAERLERWVQEVALMEQAYVRDPKQTIRQLILAVSAKTGENIRIGRFARFKIGE